MSKLKIKILSWLLHHANRKFKTQEFYAIKSQILNKHAVLQGYEVQFIEGKKCYSCGGKGYHMKLDNYNLPFADPCWFCFDGWYKRPFWSILKKVKFGSYTFHQPVERVYEKPDIISNKTIEGYIEHEQSKHSKFALVVLYMLYNQAAFKAYWQNWYKHIGRGWRLKWYHPRSYINNIAHLVRYKRKAIPFKRSEKYKYSLPSWRNKITQTEDDLPF